LRSEENEPSRQFLIKAFSDGTILANVNAHFDNKAAASDDSTDEGLKVMDDCHRVCASILRCAGRLEYSSVKELAEQINSKLDSMNDDGVAAADRENITPHVALLCLWGKTDDVATSLATSMMQSFGGDAYDDFSLDDSSKKRRKSSRRSGSKTPDVKKNLNVPQLPPQVAMQVLESILRGADPSSAAARDAILSTPSACRSLEEALDKGRIHAERLLSYHNSHDMNASDVELLLRTCETYGRFALHKAAAAPTASKTLSPQAQALLDWTTSRVIPVLSGRPTVANATPFRDLDLSRISTVSGTPASPEPMPPQSKRTDRKKTPLKLDSSFQSVDEDKIMVDMDGFAAPVSFSRGAAVSLLQSACVLFSEWLAVGLAGATEISKAASRWCYIFAANSDEQLQRELLPSFLRLSVQLGKLDCNFVVLGQLLENCNEFMMGEHNMEESALITKSVTSLLTGRDQLGNDMMGGLLQELVRAVRVIVDEEAEGPAVDHDMDEAQSTMQEVWGLDRGYVVPVLAAASSNKKASVALAKMFVGDLKKNSENASNAMMLFQVRCLWFLCEYASDAVGVQKVVRTNFADSNAADDFEGQTEGLQNVVDKLIALYA
jgi:hypothetical protein